MVAKFPVAADRESVADTWYESGEEYWPRGYQTDSSLCRKAYTVYVKGLQGKEK